MKTHLIDKRQVYPARLRCGRAEVLATHDPMKSDCRACLFGAFRDKQKELSEANDLIHKISKESNAIERRLNLTAPPIRMAFEGALEAFHRSRK